MKKQQALERLAGLVGPDLELLKNNIIVKQENCYYVFDQYEIRAESGRFRTTRRSSDIGEFSSCRSAISWCIADKYNQRRLAGQIRNLDREKSMLLADIQTRDTLSRGLRDFARREAVLSKIDSRKYRLRCVTEQLDKCINLAKYWQIRGFNNETARTGRTSPHRTHRSSH
jgi:hypothetical protein